MRLTQYFLPVLKETPAEAQIPSHQLMLRAGMIKQASTGIYSWLPLGYRVLQKVERIVCEEQDAAGSAHMEMPIIQSADIWRQSGRYEDYGKEMLRFVDRHEREMLYGPTNEELITQIFADSYKSYRDLPKMVYQIQYKFRDEIRPRFGVMRAREFYMKDGYSFDLDEDGGRRAYMKMFASYLRTFARMGLTAIPMRAETGPIGGDLSHEFIILADTGESQVYCHKDWMNRDVLAEEIAYDGDLEPLYNKWTSLYAATEEMHEADNCPVTAEELVQTRGIEVGHIFNFGTKYSEPLGAKVAGPDGQELPVNMGSYGIGISRVVAAAIEAGHDPNGIIWPEEIAPFKVVLLNLNRKDDTCTKTCEDLYRRLREAGVEVLYDDRDERAGVKLNTADLIGVPWQIIVGPKGAAKGVVEVKSRRDGDKQEVSPESSLSKLAA